ncbi:MAG TPA: SPOR domain-containing protein [Thermoanaerobaculia bacterium]|nr:SPOR domain-containing protein [Thermoanaerobaculia bacterium]
MSEPEDRSYYEISLTNGQVLVAFVTLLACVLGAFVSGMWVAREAMGPGASPAPAAHAGDSADGDALEFFGEGSRAADAGEPEPTIQQVKPLPASPAGAPEPKPAEPRGRAESERPPAVRAADTDRREPVDEPAPARAPAAEPEPSVAQPEPTAAEPTASPAPGPGFVIQVFSSIDESQADALMGRLKRAGYSAFRSAEQVGGRTVYRVRVGPYAERSAAESEAAKLKREFKVETWITGSG